MENKEKIADKKKTDYQDNLEKSRADSAAREAAKVTWKARKIIVMTVLHECREINYMKDLNKSYADSAAQSHKSYKKDTEKQCCTKSWELHEEPGEKSCTKPLKFKGVGDGTTSEAGINTSINQSRSKLPNRTVIVSCMIILMEQSFNNY